MASSAAALQTRVTSLLKIKYPIIQAGMVWTAGWELASAVSRAGGLGILGSGSMWPEVLVEHIDKCRDACEGKPFAVNLPLTYAAVKDHVKTVIDKKVPIVFTSAGNPRTYTHMLQDAGITVVHVVGSTSFALKAQQAGVDAIVCEGFEAGGHNARDETTSLCLIPAVARAVSIPLIAAGGIGDGRSMLAAMVLGAEGVQMGSRFVATKEAGCHPKFKEKVLSTQEGDTFLTLKKLGPVRMIRNPFFDQVIALEERGGSKEDLQALLGRGRAKKGMFEGNLEEGELEIGQVASLLRDLPPAGELVERIKQEYLEALSAPLHFPYRPSPGERPSATRK